MSKDLADRCSELFIQHGGACTWISRTREPNRSGTRPAKEQLAPGAGEGGTARDGGARSCFQVVPLAASRDGLRRYMKAGAWDAGGND